MAFWYWLSGAWHRSQPYSQEAHCGRLRIFFLSAPSVLRRTRSGEYQEIGAPRKEDRGEEGRERKAFYAQGIMLRPTWTLRRLAQTF